MTNMDLEALMVLLRDKDGLKRRDARLELEKIGSLAVPSLIAALVDPKTHTRWEAAKALGTIKDPKAAEALVAALRDNSFEVQWLAAEALIALKQEAIAPLLRGLIECSDSGSLLQGAHHVLHALERKHLLEAPVLCVLDALRSIDRDISVMTAAKQALEA